MNPEGLEGFEPIGIAVARVIGQIAETILRDEADTEDHHLSEEGMN